MLHRIAFLLSGKVIALHLYKSTAIGYIFCNVISLKCNNLNVVAESTLLMGYLQLYI